MEKTKQDKSLGILFKLLEVSVFLAALIVRVLLIFYGMYQDKKLNVRYTDIDYDVYNDASRYLVQGESPYNRATYRYTPLLAELLIPDILLDINFGKFLFSFFDIIIGILQYRLLRGKGMETMKALLYTSIWLFNPMSIVISTRGNAEAVVCLFVVLTFYFLDTKNIYFCSIFFGLAVHMKVCLFHSFGYHSPIDLSCFVCIPSIVLFE